MAEYLPEKNKDNIVDILDQYIDSLEDFKEAIEREDDLDLYNRFESSRNYRNSMPSSFGRTDQKAFAVYCDIIDEAGGIALSQPFLLPIISVSKTLESYTTENLKKGFCVLNSTTKIPANAP